MDLTKFRNLFHSFLRSIWIFNKINVFVTMRQGFPVVNLSLSLSLYIYILYIYIYIIMSRYLHGYSWTFFATPPYRPLLSAWYSGLHPVSAQSCCIQVLTGRPAFTRPCEGVHRSTSLTSSSQLLQQYPACLVRLILIFFVIYIRSDLAYLFNGI